MSAVVYLCVLGVGYAGNTWGRLSYWAAAWALIGAAMAGVFWGLRRVIHWATQTSPATLPPPVPPAGAPRPGHEAAAGETPAPAPIPPLPPDPLDQWIDAYMAKNGSK